MFLKKVYDLSDKCLIASTQTDMAYKYFLDLDPEAEMVDHSLLTKFQKTRIAEDILEEILHETICQSIEKGLIKSTSIIIDSTHTNANAPKNCNTGSARTEQTTTPRNSLRSQAKPPNWQMRSNIHTGYLKALAEISYKVKSVA
jgi:IS5 family transposase